MKRIYYLAAVLCLMATLIAFSVVAFAQPPASQGEHEAHHPTAQSQSAEGTAPQESGMMGRRRMMGMPMMMPCCPCGMMGGRNDGYGDDDGRREGFRNRRENDADARRDDEGKRGDYREVRQGDTSR